MNNFLRKVYFAVLAVGFFGQEIVAQDAIITVDPQDVRVSGRNHSGSPGSPFLLDQWANGTVKLMNGTVHENLSLKFNQVTEVLMFRAENKQGQLFTQPISEFSLHQDESNNIMKERKFRNILLPNSPKAAVFYEVLAEGNTSLLKRTTRRMVEERADNSLVKTKLFKDISKYYIISAGTLTRVENGDKSVIPLLRNYAAELEKYVKENKLNLNKETDLIKLVVFYNSLR